MRSSRITQGLVIALSLVAFTKTASADCPNPDPGPLDYKPAQPQSNVCTSADLTFLQQELGAGPRRAEAALKVRNSACADRVFSNFETDAALGPIVYFGVDDAYLNTGGCLEHAAGGSLACGAAVDKWETCVGARCGECQPGDAGGSHRCLHRCRHRGPEVMWPVRRGWGMRSERR